MTKIQFRQLIDMAIGSPDLGHVDFQALHFVLMSFAQRLELVEEQIEYDKNSGCAIAHGPANLTDYYTTSAEMTTPASTPALRITPVSPPLADVTKALSEKGDSPRFAKTLKKSAPHSMSCSALNSCKILPKFKSPRLKAGGDEEGGEEGPPAEEATEKPSAPESASEPPAPPKPPVIEVPTDAPTSEPVRDEEVTSFIEQPIKQLDCSDSKGGLSLKNQASQANGFDSLSPDNIRLGVCMMKDQLELAMEQISLLTEFLLDQKRDNKKIAALSRTLRRLRNIMRQNIYFESCFHRDESISWHSSDVCEEEGFEEGVVVFKKTRVLTPPPVEVEPPPIPEMCKDDLGLEPCLTYTADQLLDLFLEMRSEFCQLLNKVNTIAATILEQDYHGLMAMTANLQKEQRELSTNVKDLQYKLGKLELKFFATLKNIEFVMRDVEDLKEKKADKDQVLCWLSLKVNYEDLEKKVDKTELISFQEEIAKEFCNCRDMIRTNERNIMSIIDNLRETLGVNFLEQLIYSLRDKFQREIDLLNEKLDHYIAMTDDECAAATARVKVLKDLKCLSCDTACVMRKLHRGAVGKMPSSREAKMIGPIISYELSRIRKSGIMGFYRKEDAPRTPEDFLKEDEELVNMEKCKPRHLGGSHTITTRRDFTEKIMQKSAKKKECYEEDTEWYKKRP